MRRWHGLFALPLALICFGCPASQEVPVVSERARVSLVRERPGEARVDGVGPIVGFAKGKDCTFVHCLELVLDAVGRKISYDELMAVSGMAFRTQFRVDRWDVGNSDPLVGDSRLDDLFASIGWQYEVRVVRSDEFAEAAAMHRAIRLSIDQQVPVLAANVIPPEDWGIITGYRREPDYLCRSYNGSAQKIDTLATGWPTAVVLLTQRQPPPVREKMRLDALRRAIELFEKRAVGPFAQGSRAFDEWCQSLRSVSDPKYVHANFWTYICLIDARAAAVRYLRSVAKDFGPRQMHVTQAADFYDQEVRLLLSNREYVPQEHVFGDRLPPRELRDRQIEALQSAKKFEEQAIAALKRAM